MKKGKIFMIMSSTLICFILTAVMFMQFKVVQETKDADISSMQEAELKQGLATWKSKYQDAKEKNEELEKTINTYKEDNYSKDKTKETLESELTKLEMAMGKRDVEGPGIIITIREKKENELSEDEIITPVVAEDLIYIVNYLKDAGAEAISINDERIINTTYIVDIQSGVSMKMNGKFIRENVYIIKAIGNTSYLESSIVGKGGYAKDFDITGIKVDIEKSNKVRIPAYNGEFEQKYVSEKK